jgi:hypothetical protein
MKALPLRAVVLVFSASSILVTLTFAGCNKDSPSAPAPAQGVTRLARVELAGPTSISPGGQAQFRALAHFVDGTQRDVTAEATWSSADSAIVSIASTGVASASEQRGETDLRVAFSQMMGTLHVLVLPPGTFKLWGRVLDAGVGVSDAVVEVIDGSGNTLTTSSGTGLSASTRGAYVLYGVSGRTRIRVTKDMFHPYVQDIDVTRNWFHDVNLVLVSAPWNPSGRYTLTIAAAPECRSSLPEEVWQRTYNVEISLSNINPRFAPVTFEQRFETTNWVFWNGILHENSILFEADYYYGPAVVERLPSSLLLSIEIPPSSSRITSEVSRTAAGLEGFLTASFSIRSGAVWWQSTVTTRCPSVNHRLTFAR